MVPAQTPLRKTAASRPPRLACIEMVHGAAGSTDEGASRHYWSPAKDGADFEFSYSLEPLAPFREYITIVSGTDARQAEALAPSEGGADHFRSSAVFLTAAHAKQTAGPDISNGTSIDQLYAQRFGRDTALPSIQLCIENIALSGSCGFNYSCAYSDTISWASPTTPLPMTVNPRVVFENLFGGAARALRKDQRSRRDRAGRRPPAPRSRRRRPQPPQPLSRRGSRHRAPHPVNRESQRHRPHKGTAVRSARCAGLLGRTCQADVRPAGAGLRRGHYARLRLQDEPRHQQPHFPGKWRQDSVPHALAPQREARPGRGVRQTQSLSRRPRLGTSCAELKDTPDGDGNLLDSSLILYGSPMGDSNAHNHRRLPLLLAGHAGGQFKGNLHRVCEPGTRQANFLLTILHKLGVEIDRIGDSTGEIAI